MRSLYYYFVQFGVEKAWLNTILLSTTIPSNFQLAYMTNIQKNKVEFYEIDHWSDQLDPLAYPLLFTKGLNLEFYYTCMLGAGKKKKIMDFIRLP